MTSKEKIIARLNKGFCLEIKQDHPIKTHLNPRGATDWDCSGFVESKQAGERLLDMVKKVLGVEKPHTWMDYREDEPGWIQFKVSAKEFDVYKMEEMAEAMAKTHPDKRCILNEEILIACKK